MIVGVGIDQVSVERMASLLERRPGRAAGRLFSAGEREACQSRRSPAECFAARFAAKEAFLKAIGFGWAGGIGWHEIEVVTGSNGRPHLRLSGIAAAKLREAGGRRIHLSFTHDGGMAAAVVVIEG